MASQQKRDVMGIEVKVERDRGIYSWELDNSPYWWTKAGWLITTVNGSERRAMFSRTLEGAVGYTMGWHDASNLAQRANLSKEGEA